MTKATVTRLFVAGIVVFIAGFMLALVGAVVALADGAIRIGGPSVVTVDGPALGSALVTLVVAGLVIAAGMFLGVIAWVGALVNTFQLEDKTWFVLLPSSGSGASASWRCSPTSSPGPMARGPASHAPGRRSAQVAEPRAMPILATHQDRARLGGGGVVRFILLVTVAHAISYFVVGAIAFATLTHGLYEGADPLFGSYLRTPAETELWQHVTTWFLPAQLLRGVLIGLVLSPFLVLLRGWSVWQRTVALTGLYLVIGFWAAALAAPGNIEGLVYLRPEFTFDVVLLVQPEIVGQGVAMSLLIALGLERFR
jgi:hypothetical protein